MIEKYWVGCCQIWLWHTDHKVNGWMNGLTELIFCILMPSENSGKLKNYFNIFWVVLVKNVHGTLISKCMDEPSWFFTWCTYLTELKVMYFNSYWAGMVKYGVSFRPWDSTICRISRMNKWIEMIFCMLELMHIIIFG